MVVVCVCEQQQLQERKIGEKLNQGWSTVSTKVRRPAQPRRVPC
jgi:IS30 family transposase